MCSVLAALVTIQSFPNWNNYNNYKTTTMAKLEVSITVISSTPNNYVLNVTIENRSKRHLRDVTIKEGLLTYTNAIFSSLTIDGVPVNFLRQILEPILWHLEEVRPKSRVILSYPVSVYARVDLPTTFTSSVTVVGYRCEKEGEPERIEVTAHRLLTTLSATVLPTPRIAIVGGGLAGLTAAYQLSQFVGSDGTTFTPVVYEGSERLGGRCYSGYYKDGESFEHGGELIDTDHLELLTLISTLGLTINNLRSAEKPRTQEFYQVLEYPDEGDCKEKPHYVIYKTEQASFEFFNIPNPSTGLTIYQQMTNDANNTFPPEEDSPPSPNPPWPLTYGGGDPNSLARAITLDSMSVDEYVDSVTSFLRRDGDGAKTKLGQLLKVAYTEEFGAEPCEQSSLNLIYLLGFIPVPTGIVPPNIPSEYFYLFGLSDETYHTNGGNSRIVERLLEELQQKQVSIFVNTRLSAVRHRTDLPPVDDLAMSTPQPNYPYELTLVQDGKVVTPAPFDYFISAIPFSVYNSTPVYNNWGIDISKADWSNLKQYAINYLAIGRNSKLNLQFKDRFWNQLGNNGSTYVTSNPYLTTPCGGDRYEGAQVPITEPGNPVGINIPPVHSPAEGAVGEYEKKYENTWEVSRAQPQIKGALVNYLGGRRSQMIKTSAMLKERTQHNEYLKREVELFLKQLQRVLPGSKRNFEFEYDVEGYINNVITNNWKQSPWQRGAYAFWQPGQYVAGEGTLVGNTVVPPGSVVPFAGYEAVSEPYNSAQTGNALFAGEQTSYNYQGYMNGAVESGDRVMNQLLALQGF